ncbi:hypothetical protein [Enterococcus sp. HY326]|uniref:hypothetical protein n=1 Tax=Enterococcus sp. HY326 TaxID=2971265 RepID=UPI00223F634C|nr:hypothetical protein [Enterococcus sp. HY326]
MTAAKEKRIETILGVSLKKQILRNKYGSVKEVQKIFKMDVEQFYFAYFTLKNEKRTWSLFLIYTIIISSIFIVTGLVGMISPYTSLILYLILGSLGLLVAILYFNFEKRKLALYEYVYFKLR